MRTVKLYALSFNEAMDAAPGIGSIDFENATRIANNLWQVTIWHESDDPEHLDEDSSLDDVHPFFAATVVSACLLDEDSSLDDVHPFFAATVVSACLLLVLAVIVALVQGLAVLIKLVF
jgi:hypothetical protein